MTVAIPSRPKAMPRKPVAKSAAHPPVHGKVIEPEASLTLSSKNYSSWSLRGWLMARFVGLEFREVMVSPDDVDARKELLLLAPSIRVPCLTHDGARVWNTLAIAQYLNEIKPNAGLMPDDRIARAHCRSVSGEMNSGFANLRSSLPMNLKASFPGHKVWAGAQPDIDRIVEIWAECLQTYVGPFLFGTRRGMADAMYAPVVTRFLEPRRAVGTVRAADSERHWHTSRGDESSAPASAKCPEYSATVLRADRDSAVVSIPRRCKLRIPARWIWVCF